MNNKKSGAHAVEAKVRKRWRKNAQRPLRRKVIIKLARFIDALPLWLERYKYPVALFGLLSGFASYYFIDRQPNLAAGIAIASILGWLLLMLEALVLSSAQNTRWSNAGRGVYQITLQTIHQEALFFVLTFAVLTANWQSGQAIGAVLIIALTVAAAIDPIYHLVLARSRLSLMCFHAFTLFCCAFLALPVALQVPLDEAFMISLGFTVVITTPLLVVTLNGSKASRVARSTLLMSCFISLIWAGRAWLPPMSTELQTSAVSTQIDEENKSAINPATVFNPTQLTEDGLYAFTPVRAPQGLNQGVTHEWKLNGKLVDSIPMQIIGGRTKGFRAWSHKRNFPSNPRGEWQVTLKTPKGLILGRLTFTVE